MRILLGSLISVLLLLNYHLWLAADRGVREVRWLHAAIAEQQAKNAKLNERNRGLEAEVNDLKTGVEAIEERARTDLGMVQAGETFFRILEEPLPLADAAALEAGHGKP